MKRSDASTFEAAYPAITRWVKEFGSIEVGQDEFSENFVKAVDPDGMAWGGKSKYGSIDEALQDLENGIRAVVEAQGLGETPAPRRRRPKRSPKKSRTSAASSDSRHAPTKPRKSRGRAEADRHRSSAEQKALEKVRKLESIAEALRDGKSFSVTRLTVLKGLCEDRKAAGEFALFLTRKVQKTLREKRGADRWRKLVNRAVREMKRYLDRPTDEQRNRLWSLFREMEEEQNEYKPIPFGVLRIVNSMELLIAEQCLHSLLNAQNAPYWLYQAARDYAERWESRYPQGLSPRSAPMIEEIARFWRRHVSSER